VSVGTSPIGATKYAAPAGSDFKKGGSTGYPFGYPGNKKMKQKMNSYDNVVAGCNLLLVCIFIVAVLFLDENEAQQIFTVLAVYTIMAAAVVLIPARFQAWIWFWIKISAAMPIVVLIYGVSGVRKYVMARKKYFKHMHGYDKER